MHICREVNLASSSSWMYIAYIDYLSIDIMVHLYWYIFFNWYHVRRICFIVYLDPFVDDWQKGGEVDQYICMFWRKDLCSCIAIKRIWCVSCLFMHVYLHVFAYMLWAFIAYLFVYCDAWVKGELLWSFTLIHAYITPWVLSSSKKGRLLAQRPSTLVLMMINSCNYVY